MLMFLLYLNLIIITINKKALIFDNKIASLERLDQ